MPENWDFLSHHVQLPIVDQKKKNYLGGGALGWALDVRWAKIAQNRPKMGTLQKTFLFLLKSRDFFQPSYTTTYMGELKNIYLKFFWGGTVVRSADTAKNELSKNGHSAENIFDSAESRDFFQPLYTTTYGEAKNIYT
jgi:hypothetical protein